MAKDQPYRKVPSAIWRRRFFTGLGDDGRLLWLYLRTCPHNNPLGCFVLPVGYIMGDLGWSEARCHRALDELLAQRFEDGSGNVLVRDERNGLVLLRGQVEDEGLANGNVVKAACKALANLPTSPSIFEDLRKDVRRLDKPFTKPLEQALLKRIGEGLANDGGIQDTRYKNNPPQSPPLGRGGEEVGKEKRDGTRRRGGGKGHDQFGGIEL